MADLTFDQAGLFVGALDDLALSSSFRQDQKDGSWHCLWTLEDAEESAAIKSRLLLACALHNLPAISLDRLRVEPLPDANWLEESYAGFQPFTLGPFFVFGSHHRDTPKPDNAVPLEIDAATAFGSGEHGTTAGCLLAMVNLRNQGFTPAHCLDMGTGSGILAIAAAKLWPSLPVLAVDNDPECIAVTKRHAEFNKVPPAQISAFVSEGFSDSRLTQETRFDLVIANILAGPLIAMAADLARATAPGGYLLLSGLLIEQMGEVMAAYTSRNMTLVKADTQDEWAILTLCHGN